VNKKINESDHIDQIRQIIFGEQMETYKRKFNQYIHEIEELKKNFENLIRKMDEKIKHFEGQLENRAQIFESVFHELGSNLEEKTACLLGLTLCTKSASNYFYGFKIK